MCTVGNAICECVHDLTDLRAPALTQLPSSGESTEAVPAQGHFHWHISSVSQPLHTLDLMHGLLSDRGPWAAL